MKQILVLSLVTAAVAASAAPSVSGTAVSVDVKTRTATVTYTLSESAVVTFDILTNGVSVGGRNLRGAVGDVNRKVASGPGTITWCWPQDFDGLQLAANAATVRVTAWPLDSLPDYMVCDLRVPGGSIVKGTCMSFYPGEDFLPGGIESDAYRTDYLVLRRIPAKGVKWRMGSPDGESGHRDGEERHWVTFTNDYYMGVFPLTQGQFYTIMREANPTDEEYTRTTDDPLCPMDGLRWQILRSAAAVDNWLPPEKVNRHGGGWLVLHRLWDKIRFEADMPTDAEWEYACRAGEPAMHYDGTDDDSTLDRMAWYAGNSGGKLHRVGEKAPNRWGLYDMYGNVNEWCLDNYTTNVFTSAEHVDVNPPGPTVCDPTATGGVQWNRVVRGGSCNSQAGDLRSARRQPINISGKKYYGFRVVCPFVSLAE